MGDGGRGKGNKAVAYLHKFIGNIEQRRAVLRRFYKVCDLQLSCERHETS